MDETNKNKGLSMGTIIIGAVVILILFGVIWAFSFMNTGQNGNLTTDIPETTEPIETEDDIEEVVENPTDYIGQEIVIGGEVERLLGNNAFILEEDELFDRQILLVSETPVTDIITNTDEGTLLDEDRVRVTGTAQAYTLTEIETEYGFDLDPEVEFELEDIGAYVVATNIEVNPTENEQ